MPDKGSGVVILNNNDYNDIMKTILKDTTKFLDLGSVTNKDNTARIESRMQRLLQQSGPLRGKKCAGARPFLGPLSNTIHI